MKIGYVRVSTQEQNTLRQEVLMRDLGVHQLYVDRSSGKNTDRPELRKMLAYVRQGDTVIVESISRFARNTRDLLGLVEQLTDKQVEFVSQKEAIDTTTPTGKFMLTIFGAVAELEREYILQRQREGIAIAKEQGNVIKLEHNQFVSTNRHAAVELRITMEAFGTEHKNEIMKALEDEGFRPREIGAKLY